MPSCFLSQINTLYIEIWIIGEYKIQIRLELESFCFMEQVYLGLMGHHRFETKTLAGFKQLAIDDLREIENAASNIAVQGDRYPEALERRTGL